MSDKTDVLWRLFQAARTLSERADLLTDDEAQAIKDAENFINTPVDKTYAMEKVRKALEHYAGDTIAYSDGDFDGPPVGLKAAKALRLLSAPVDDAPAFEVIEKGGQPFFHIPHLNWPVGTKFYTHPPVNNAPEPSGFIDEYGNFENSYVPWMQDEAKRGVEWSPLYTTPPNTVPVAELEALAKKWACDGSPTAASELRALIANHKVTP